MTLETFKTIHRGLDYIRKEITFYSPKMHEKPTIEESHALFNRIIKRAKKNYLKDVNETQLSEVTEWLDKYYPPQMS